MTFAQDLLRLSRQLASLSGEFPEQASLRRAVSTAYYAIFHLLVTEATANWAQPELRAILGRCFDHGPMKVASGPDQIKKLFRSQVAEPMTQKAERDLSTVAKAFIQAQQNRTDADYNLAKEWAPVEVDAQIASVEQAFESWERIRQTSIAQSYLVSLLPSKNRGTAKSG